ncbi:MAG: 50S ribosomal protein L22 [Candidatus Sungbacteria bacterium]|nr:50S ribosomal protein L22 [Candidatus Sungbacteria bacterium]
MAPRKVRLVAALLKGMETARAQTALHHLPKRAAEPLLKLLQSAVANAAHNFQLPETGLYIKDVRVNSGPVTKRFMPRAFGRAAPIRKKMSHVTLVLEARESATEPIRSRRQKNSDVTVREAEAQDLRREFSGKQGEQTTKQADSHHKRQANFAPRVFRRKAI